MAALARRWGSPKHVQDMLELLARLGGELSKDVGAARAGPAFRMTTLRFPDTRSLYPAMSSSPPAHHTT